MEPFRLRRWKLPSWSGSQKLYTCARPGRSKGHSEEVSDELIHAWVRGLPSERDLAVVSLLGTKKKGKSEWSFYSFHKAGRSFQDWLHQHYADKIIEVAEHPTTDSVPVPNDVLRAVSADISRYLRAGRTVAVMDSGGMERTGQICTGLQATEDFSG